MKETFPFISEPPREENPFTEPETAKLWIESVEGEVGGARDGYIYPLLQTWLQDAAMQDVLDIGAGQGIASPLARGKRYVGLEPSETLVRRAKEKYQGCGDFIVGDAYAIPFPEKSFDGVFSINVWFHLQNPSVAAQEIARVLRPRGKFLIITPNPDAYSVWEAFYEDGRKEGNKLVGKVHIPLVTLPKNIFYQHTNAQIVSDLEQVGLSIQESNAIAPTPDSGIMLFRYYSGELRTEHLDHLNQHRTR